jgi:hypothetical protein
MEKLENVIKLKVYLINVNSIIDNILNKEPSTNLTYDLLDSPNIIQNKLICLKYKQIQMKIGLMWQNILGSYYNFTNLNNGHKTGLDIISHKKKIIIELKNRTNTDNNSSKKENFNKLALFKKNNPDYLCIYGCINENTKDKTLRGSIKKIKHNNQDIYIYTGYKLLQRILEKNTYIIIYHIQNKLHEFYNIID